MLTILTSIIYICKYTFQMSVMPRFLNTMRLTQAVYETAASILVTVSTVKSFPALMTLPFVDQVLFLMTFCQILCGVFPHVFVFFFLVWIAPRELAWTVYFDSCAIFFGNRHFITTRRTQIQLWVTRHRRTNRVVQGHIGRGQTPANPSNRTVFSERNRTAQIR